MRVISVIPDTGLLPTIAMALAATVVNREGYDCNEKNTHNCMQQVEVHHTKIEEQEGDDEGGNTSESNNLKGNITLCTEGFLPVHCLYLSSRVQPSQPHS